MEVDDFWKENAYFGKFNDLNLEDQDDVDYYQSSSGEDEFDTDFQDTSDLSEGEGGEDGENED